MWIFFLEGLEFSILEFLGLGVMESWGGGLVCCCGARYSEVLNVNRKVLNVNRSLYGSTSPGRAQQDVLRAQRAHPVRAPDLYYHRGSCLRLIVSTVVLLYYWRTPETISSISVHLSVPACLPACVQWELKKILAPHGERFTYFELLGLQDCRIPIVSDSTVGFSRNPSFFVVAAAFWGLGSC